MAYTFTLLQFSLASVIYLIYLDWKIFAARTVVSVVHKESIFFWHCWRCHNT